MKIISKGIYIKVLQCRRNLLYFGHGTNLNLSSVHCYLINLQHDCVKLGYQSQNSSQRKHRRPVTFLLKEK